MRYALTALALTVLYLLLVAVSPPVAQGTAWFYIVAVLILVVACRKDFRA
jgi:inner membrane protein involved in colicin E2 resistance